MTPDNTNYDTLQVYFDYLEDNNHDTSQLRESLTENNPYWICEYMGGNKVGSGHASVGVANLAYYDHYHYGFMWDNTSTVGFGFLIGNIGTSVSINVKYCNRVGGNWNDT